VDNFVCQLFETCKVNEAKSVRGASLDKADFLELDKCPAQYLEVEPEVSSHCSAIKSVGNQKRIAPFVLVVAR
jgi:hypothetical protein